MAEERTDPELIQRYLAGDAAAFSTLVRRHEKRVYNLCYRMLGREEDARDAAQDAFLTALRKLSSFRGEAQFTTWLHRVTVNACYDVLRKKKREPLLEPARDEDAPEPPGPASPDHADSAAVVVDVQRALMRVPQEFRAVLVLHDVHDMGYDDIAGTLGIPVGTVKSRLHRGRVALAEELGEAGRGRGRAHRAAESEPGSRGHPEPLAEALEPSPETDSDPLEPAEPRAPSKERFPE